MTRTLAVVINWNQAQLTLNCTKSLLNVIGNYGNLLVIDNHSNERDFLHLENGLKNFDVTLERTEQNIGFAGGCNHGLKKALEEDYTHLLLINNDLTLQNEALEKMLEVQKNQGAIVVGPLVKNLKNQEVLFNGRVWPLFLFGVRSSNFKVGKKFSNTSYVEGSCMLIDLERLRKLDAELRFDPHFFMYCEETDFCLKLKKAGEHFLIANEAIAYHSPSESLGGPGNPYSYYYLTRNRLLLAKRWLNPFLFIFFFFYYLVSRMIIQTLRFRKNSPLVRQAVIQGLVDGVLSKSGKWKLHPNP